MHIFFNDRPQSYWFAAEQQNAAPAPFVAAATAADIHRTDPGPVQQAGSLHDREHSGYACLLLLHNVILDSRSASARGRACARAHVATCTPYTHHRRL